MTTLIHCACGKVEMVLEGEPILTAACHCDDCQAGGAKLEARPGAWKVRDPSGGTWCALYRKDRYRVTRGAELLDFWKLRDTPTNRVVATCCNSGLFVNYDSGPHWVAVYRPGYHGSAPPLQMRVNTKWATAPVPDDVPAYRSFPPSFIWRLIKARVAMMFG